MIEKIKQIITHQRMDKFYTLKYFNRLHNIASSLYPEAILTRELFILSKAFWEFADLIQDPNEAFQVHYKRLQQITI